MRVRISNAVREPKEVERLVRSAFRAVGDGVAGKDTEVHVRAGWETRGAGRRARDMTEWVSGYAYQGVPDEARVAPRTEWLVTLKMPADPNRHRLSYPRSWSYPGLKTAPMLRVECWHEHVFLVAAHEAFHVRQMRRDWPLSEVDADREALRLLRHSRTEGGLCTCEWRASG